jgi:hypothetical protein
MKRRKRWERFMSSRSQSTTDSVLPGYFGAVPGTSYSGPLIRFSSSEQWWRSWNGGRQTISGCEDMLEAWVGSLSDEPT